MGKLERQIVIGFTIVIWAMASVLYAHLHHWSLFDNGTFPPSSNQNDINSQPSFSVEDQSKLLEQITLLEEKQNALSTVFNRWHESSELPSSQELVSMGVAPSVAIAYEKAKQKNQLQLHDASSSEVLDHQQHQYSAPINSLAKEVETVAISHYEPPQVEKVQNPPPSTIQISSLPPPPPPPPPPPSPLSAPQVNQAPVVSQSEVLNAGETVKEDGSLGKLIAGEGGHHRRLVNRGSSVIVVGGSDGSGTRSVVATLEKLGVYMIVDDRGTNDVHAAEMGGWPPVVSPVMSAAKTADYELSSLSRNVREGTMNKMSRFIDSMKRQGTNGQKKLLKRKDSGEKVKVASGVSYGYKAPVSMLLVPFMREIYARDGFKFLQVVRDGRDIAFSGNQSPVTKFYKDTFSAQDYAKWDRLPEVRGIKLWSEWNADVHEYGTRRNNARDADFEHLTIHTEDLIDPDTKFETVREIAGFVGANDWTNDELCCMVIAPEEFMGSHAKEVKGRGEQGSAASNQLKKRFGHWHSKLEGKQQLSEAMHKEGARGLKLFGYEPEVERDHTPKDGYHCTLTVEDCNALGIAVKVKGGGVSRGPAHGSSEAVDSDKCSFAKDVDYYGPESRDIVAVHTPDAAGCCEDCRSHDGCSFFTYDPAQSLCFLKGSQGAQRKTVGLISGHIK